MRPVTKKTGDQAKGQLERIRDLANYGLSSDQANRQDPAEWYRTILRAAGDVREEAKILERRLSDEALEKKVIGPTEIAKAARITTAALYKRRKSDGS